MSKMNRRQFVKRSSKAMAGVAGASVAWSSVRSAKALGANDRVRVGLIGAGGRGSAVGTGFAEHKESELAYVCDLHTGRLDSRAKYFATKQGGKRPGMTKHMNQLFDDKNIDAILVATPDQWHCLATIRACQALWRRARSVPLP